MALMDLIVLPHWENQAISTITWYPTQPHYPDTELTSPCPILIIPGTWLGSNKYQFYKSLVWLDHWFKRTISCMRDECFTDSATAPSQYVKCFWCIYNWVRALLLLCISIPGSVASVNRFSSCTVRYLLLCISITVDLASVFALACQLNLVLVENTDVC